MEIEFFKKIPPIGGFLRFKIRHRYKLIGQTMPAERPA